MCGCDSRCDGSNIIAFISQSSFITLITSLIIHHITHHSSHAQSTLKAHTHPLRSVPERELLYDKILDVSFTGHSGHIHFKPKIGDRFPVKMEIVNIFVAITASSHS